MIKMGKLKPTRQEYKAENTTLKETIKRLEARESIKYLHKLEKTIRGLNVVIKTKDLNILKLNKIISELSTKIVQEESFKERLDRKSKKKGLKKK